MRGAGSVPDNFSFNETLSPGPFPGIHSQPQSGGHRGTHKRAGVGSLLSSSSNAGSSSSSSNGNSSSNKRIEGTGDGGGGGGLLGIALHDGGDSLLDEESQNILSSSKKALAER